MSFFGRPVRPTGGVARAVVVNPPAWTGPPHNVLPGIAPVQLIVARTDEKVVAIAGIQTSKESRAEIDAASILELDDHHPMVYFTDRLIN